MSLGFFVTGPWREDGDSRSVGWKGGIVGGGSSTVEPLGVGLGPSVEGPVGFGAEEPMSYEGVGTKAGDIEGFEDLEDLSATAIV